MNVQVAIGTLLALLAAFTIFMVVWFGGAGASPTAGELGTNDALVAELRHLAQSQERTALALERLEAVLADRLDTPPPPGSARSAVSSGPAPESFDELIVSLDALRTTFEAESRRTQELIRTAPAFGGESLQEVLQRSSGPNWISLEELEKSWRADKSQANQSQYFQTSRDLLVAYGPPTAIHRPTGGLLYAYRRHAEGGAGPAWFFRMQDGIVVEFFLLDEK